jgi:hypothetical protein
VLAAGIDDGVPKYLFAKENPEAGMRDGTVAHVWQVRFGLIKPVMNRLVIRWRATKFLAGTDGVVVRVRHVNLQRRPENASSTCGFCVQNTVSNASCRFLS